MADEMGILRTDVEIESPLREGERRLLRDVLVDTGAELTWAPSPVLESLGVARRKAVRFQQADGTILERWVGFAIVHAGGTFTNDEVVFGEPGDLVLLGARSLEGLNLKVDLVGKRLVSAGPMLAAASITRPRLHRGFPRAASGSLAVRLPQFTEHSPEVLREIDGEGFGESIRLPLERRRQRLGRSIVRPPAFDHAVVDIDHPVLGDVLSLVQLALPAPVCSDGRG